MWSRHQIRLLSLAGAGVALILAADVRAEWKVGEAHPALFLKSTTVEGPVSIDSYRGRKLVLIHFAPWCQASVDTLNDWLKATESHRQEKKLTVIGVMHEQYRDRAALFVRWKKIDIPILHDPLDLSRVAQLPSVVAIDEEGLVRAVDPDPETIEEEFVDKKFKHGKFEVRAPVLDPPDPRALKRRAAESRMPSVERELADAYMLGGTPREIDQALRIYSQLLQRNATDAYAFFRLGVGLRLRHDSPSKQEKDKSLANESLRNALKLKPKNDVFRARAAQFDKSIEKPKGGADHEWVKRAKKELKRQE